MRAPALLLIAGGVLAAGCGTARRGEPLGPPFEPTDSTVVTGQHVFMIHCHQCHPGGAAGLGPSINDKPLPDAMIRLQVRQGLGAMPAFDDRLIPDDDLDALVEYLNALRRHGT
jgi:mono/diheme cytochrome c family protein